MVTLFACTWAAGTPQFYIQVYKGAEGKLVRIAQRWWLTDPLLTLMTHTAQYHALKRKQ